MTIRLDFARKRAGIAGSVALGWAFDQETAEFIEQEEEQHSPIGQHFSAQLLLVVAPAQGYHPSKEKRWICELMPNMSHIDFVRGGENRIFAQIVFGARLGIERLYLRKKDGEYATTVLTPDGTMLLESPEAIKDGCELQIAEANRLRIHLLKSVELKSEDESVEDWVQRIDQIGKNYQSVVDGCNIVIERSRKRAVHLQASLTADVPIKAFGKAPSAWERSVLTWLAPLQANDECDWRWRRIWAWPAFIVLLPIKIVFMLAFLGLMLFCMLWSKIEWRSFLHPIAFSFDEVFDQAKAFFLPRLTRIPVPDDTEDEDAAPEVVEDQHWRWFFFLVWPPLLVGCFWFWDTHPLVPLRHIWWASYGLALITPTAIASVVLCFVLLCVGIHKVAVWWKARWWMYGLGLLYSLVAMIYCYVYLSFTMDLARAGRILPEALWSVLGLVFAGCICVAFCKALWPSVREYLQDWYDEYAPQESTEEPRAVSSLVRLSRIHALAGSGPHVPLTLRALPPEQRTVKLYFGAVKGRICKPLQK